MIGEEVSGIVLAGGQSSRLGRNKALIELTPGEPLIARILRRLRPLCAELIVVTNSPDLYTFLGSDVRLHPDLIRHRGPLGGLYTGLVLATHRHALAVACDMPFLNEGLLRHLIQGCHGYDAVVPRIGSVPQPLHAVYSKDALPTLETQLHRQNLKMAEILPHLFVHYVEEAELRRFDPSLLSFSNINTATDLEQAQVLVGAGGL